MTYTTIQGDTWDLIAYKVYGTEYVMDKLIQANTDYVDTVIFGAGTVLHTPDFETVQIPESVPPWMR